MEGGLVRGVGGRGTSMWTDIEGMGGKVRRSGWLGQLREGERLGR